MTEQPIDMNQIRNYFAGKLEQHGATPRGVDWNSTGAQDIRFSQLAKVIDPTGYDRFPFWIMEADLDHFMIT